MAAPTWFQNAHVTLAKSPADKSHSEEYHAQGLSTGDKPDRGIKTRFAYGNGDKKMEDGAVSHTAPEWFQIGGITVTSDLVMKQPEPEPEPEPQLKVATPAKETEPTTKAKASQRAKAQPLGKFSFVKEETKTVAVKEEEKVAAKAKPKAAKKAKEATVVPKLKLTPPQRKTKASTLAALAVPKRTPLQKIEGNQSPAMSTPPVKTTSQAPGSLKREVFRKDAVPGRRGLVFANMESNCIDKKSLTNALAKVNPDKTALHRRRIDVQTVDEEAQGSRCVDMLNAQVRNASLHRVDA